MDDWRGGLNRLTIGIDKERLCLILNFFCLCWGGILKAIRYIDKTNHRTVNKQTVITHDETKAPHSKQKILSQSLKHPTFPYFGHPSSRCQ